MDIAHELARRINGLEYAALPAQVVSNAKLAIVDTIGVTLAGSREEAPKRLLRVPGLADPGPSLVLGHAVRTSALNAAVVNGVSAHALDFDVSSFRPRPAVGSTSRPAPSARGSPPPGARAWWWTTVPAPGGR